MPHVVEYAAGAVPPRPRPQPQPAPPPRRFHDLDVHEQAAEVTRTRAVVMAMLREARQNFPAVPVLLDGRPVHREAVEAAWSRVRFRKLGRLGRPFDPVPVLVAELRAAIAEVPPAGAMAPLPRGADAERLRPLVAPLHLRAEDAEAAV